MCPEMRLAPIAADIASIAALIGASFGATRIGVFRAGGIALPIACRTVRRCT